jgi:hypothetical protein
MFRTTTIYTLATMLALSVGCFAQPPKIIAQKLADQLDQAGADRDVNRSFSFYDPSFVSSDQKGNRWTVAELRKQVEQNSAQYRYWKPRTTVEDAQLEAGRMVVYYKTEVHYQFHHQRAGWMGMIYNESGETTWEKKGGQWKMVRNTVFRSDAQGDPVWLQQQRDLINAVTQPNRH